MSLPESPGRKKINQKQDYGKTNCPACKRRVSYHKSTGKIVLHKSNGFPCRWGPCGTCGCTGIRNNQNQCQNCLEDSLFVEKQAENYYFRIKNPKNTLIWVPKTVSDSDLEESYDRLAKSVAPGGPDIVNHPAHYTAHPSGVECIEITEHMNFCLGNAFKYIWRAGLKSDDPIRDLEKAKWYLEREIARHAAQ